MKAIGRWLFVLGLILWGILIFKLSLNLYSAYYVLLFITSILLCALPWWPIHLFKSIHLKAPEIIFIILVMFVFFLINFMDMTNWYFTVIGDEYAFYSLAKSILDGQVFNIFSQEGAYGLIPVMSAYYQAGVMKIFGATYTGWKLSNIIIVISSFPFLFYIAKVWIGKIGAFTTLLFTAFSHFLWAYTHTGYANVESIFPTISALATATLGLQKKAPIFIYFAGVLSALGWYTFYPSRITFVLVLILLIFHRHTALSMIQKCTPFVLAFILTISPILAVNKTAVITSMLSRSLSNPYPPTTDSPLQHFANNLVRTFFGFTHGVVQDAFIGGPLIDPVTGVLFLIGFGVIFLKKKTYTDITLLSYFLIGVIVTGGFSQYKDVTVSRLFYIIPAMALIGSYTIEKGFLYIKKKTKHDKVVTLILLSGIAINVLVLNIYQFKYVTPNKLDGSPEAVAISATQEPFCKNKTSKPVIVVSDIKGSPLWYAIPALENIYPVSGLKTAAEIASEKTIQFDLCYIFVNWNHAETIPDNEIIEKRSGMTKSFVYDQANINSVMVLH